MSTLPENERFLVVTCVPYETTVNKFATPEEADADYRATLGLERSGERVTYLASVLRRSTEESQRVADALSPTKVLCPNCGDPVGHAANGCVLETLFDVVRNRQTLTEAELQALWTKANIDQIWDDIGPILDRLEAGDYSDES